MTYQIEFPDYPVDAMPAIPEGFADKSWHNDACPLFLNESNGLAIFADYPDPAMRDCGPEVPRFSVMYLPTNSPDAGRQIDDETVTLFAVEEWEGVNDFLDELAMREGDIDEAARGARMRLNLLTAADARHFLDAEIAFGKSGGKACPDLIDGMREIIAKAEGQAA